MRSTSRSRATTTPFVPVSLLTRVIADAVADGLMARSGAQTGTEAEVEPMPDWELELLGASQEPAPATPHDVPASDAAPVPAEEQPEEVAIEAERGGGQASEMWSCNPTMQIPKTSTTPTPGRPTANTSLPTNTNEDHANSWQRSPLTEVKKLRDATGAGMMDCKKALTEADGDFRQGCRNPARERPGQGGQARRRTGWQPTAWWPPPMARMLQLGG